MPSLRRFLPLFVLPSAVLAAASWIAPAAAATLIVPDRHATLQAAIDAAGTGDTVLVRSGAYQESGIALRSGLTVMGETGDPADVVFTDGEGRINLSAVDVDSTTVVAGITFTGGRRILGLTRADPRFVSCVFSESKRYEAVPMEDSAPWFVDCDFRNNRAEGCLRVVNSAPRFTSCRFTDNRSGDDLSAYPVGGAAVIADSRPVFDHCLFEGNLAWDAGGAIICWGLTTIALDGCTFRDCWGSSGGALYANADCTLTVRDCRFESNVAQGRFSGGGGPGYGGAIRCSGALTVTGSVFVGNRAYTRNTLGGGGGIFGGDGTTVSRCVFAANQADLGSAVRGAAAIDHTIITGGSGGAAVSGGDPACCDIWGNEGGDWVGDLAPLLGVDGNICADPDYCDAAAGIYTVCADSPCLPTGEPGSCSEPIGFGAGCSSCNVSEAPPPLPAATGLREIHPNPFNPLTRITLHLAAPQRALLAVHDLGGKRVAILHDGPLSAGTHAFAWQGRDAAGRSLATGVYLVRLSTAAGVDTRKVLLLR